MIVHSFAEVSTFCCLEFFVRLLYCVLVNAGGGRGRFGDDLSFLWSLDRCKVQQRSFFPSPPSNTLCDLQSCFNSQSQYNGFGLGGGRLGWERSKRADSRADFALIVTI